MKNHIALVLAAVVVISGCSQIINDVNPSESAGYNYRHEIELQTSDMDTAQGVVDELRERHQNLGVVSNIGVKPNQSTENIRYYIKTVNNSGPEIEQSISEMSFSAEVPFIVQDSRTLNLDEPVQIMRKGDQLSIGDQTLTEGETVEVQNYNITLNNTDSDQAIVHITVLEQPHIVRTADRTVRSGPNGFTGRISTQLSQEGSERLQNVLQNYNSSEEGYLQDLTGENVMITPVVQGERMQSLIISDDLRRRTQTFAVSVRGETQSEVEDKLDRYEAILDSSELETGIEYIDVGRINQEEN